MDASTSFRSTAITLTPAYSPPEALESTLASARADVYSLGATLFALVAGHAPYVDGTADVSLLVLMRRILDDPVPDLRPAVPDALQRVLERAMAKDPAARYDDAAQLAQALRAVETDGPGPADALPSPAPPLVDERPERETAGSRPLLLIGALTCALAAVAVLVAMVGGSDDDGDTFGASPTTGSVTEPDEASDGGDAAEPRQPTADVAGAGSSDGPSGAADPPGGPTPDTSDAATDGAPDAAPPPAPVAGGQVGPSDFEPYATSILEGDGSPWTVVPRAGETIIRVDPATLAVADATDLGFFAPVVVIGSGWIAGAGTQRELGVVDLADDAPIRIDLERNARHLAADGDVLWVVTADDDGSNATLHRFDRRDLTEEATTAVNDFVLHLDAAEGRIWTAAGSNIKAFDAESLAPVIDTSTGVGPIDDIDAHGDALWVSGGVFASELADNELARGAAVRIDAATGAAAPVVTLTDGLSIFERATVAATDDGAWVTVETTNEAFFVGSDGTVGGVLALPDDVQDAEVIGDALWVLSGGSGSGQLFALELPAG